MDLNWLQSALYGFLSGLMDILPVSAQAHKVLLVKFFGVRGNANLLELLIHLAIFSALYYSCQAHIIRINRARALARIPKKKRKRPLDTRTLMDWSLRYTQSIQTNMLLISLFLFLNGIILYIPQFLPTSNRDSRTLSRVEGLLMGLGGAASILPGVSAIGTAASIGSVCGVDRNYGLNMALMMNMVLAAGLSAYDIMSISATGIGTLSFLILLQYLFTAVCAFAGTIVGIRIMRQFAAGNGYVPFGVYCWGMALFTFILNLMA